MSVELFIYPQFYDSTWNPASQVPQEWCPDGLSFLTIGAPNLSQNADSSPLDYAVLNVPPIVQNNWYIYKTNGGAFGSGVYPSVGGWGSIAYLALAPSGFSLANRDR